MSDVIVWGGVGKLEAKDIGILPFTQQFREDHRTVFSSKRRIGVSIDSFKQRVLSIDSV